MALQAPWPIDGKEYTAEAISAWAGTRTRGVFAADDCLQVTASGMNLTLSPGVAWLKAAYQGQVSKYFGQVLYNNAPITIPVVRPGVYNYYCRVVLGIDMTTTPWTPYFDVKFGPGFTFPQNPPQYPPVERSANRDEIGLGYFTLTAGATNIIFYDSRLDESVCGLMRDAVTGIPTQALYQSWYTWFENVQYEWENYKNDFGQAFVDVSSAVAGAATATQAALTAAYNANKATEKLGDALATVADIDLRLSQQYIPIYTQNSDGFTPMPQNTGVPLAPDMFMKSVNRGGGQFADYTPPRNALHRYVFYIQCPPWLELRDYSGGNAISVGVLFGNWTQDDLDNMVDGEEWGYFEHFTITYGGGEDLKIVGRNGQMIELKGFGDAGFAGYLYQPKSLYSQVKLEFVEMVKIYV